MKSECIMGKIILTSVLMLFFYCASAQENSLQQISSKLELPTLTSLIENVWKGTFISTKENLKGSYTLKSHTYLLKEWQGIGKCRYFSYYTLGDSLIGCEMYFVPPVSKTEVMKTYTNAELLDSLLFDANGIPSVNYYYAENNYGLYLVMSSYIKTRNEIVILTFFDERWASLIRK